jgi:urease accessory protein
LRASSVCENGKTVLRNIFFTAPLKLLPPHLFVSASGEEAIRVTQLNVSAGIMAGDSQDICITIGGNTRVYWTSQSFEKLHKMNEGQWAHRDCRVDVAANAELHYRPLPVIAFADSDFRAHTVINLANETSRLVYSDIFSSGRVMRGESFAFRRYSNLLEVRQAGRLVCRDNTDYQPAAADNPNSIRGIGMFEGYTHTAAMLLCNTRVTVDSVREQLAAYAQKKPAAATTQESGVVLVKALGNSAEELENLISAVCHGCR